MVAAWVVCSILFFCLYMMIDFKAEPKDRFTKIEILISFFICLVLPPVMVLCILTGLLAFGLCSGLLLLAFISDKLDI